MKKVLEVKRRKEVEEAMIEQQFADANEARGIKPAAPTGAGAGAAAGASSGKTSMLQGADDVDLLF